MHIILLMDNILSKVFVEVREMAKKSIDFYLEVFVGRKTSVESEKNNFRW